MTCFLTTSGTGVSGPPFGAAVSAMRSSTDSCTPCEEIELSPPPPRVPVPAVGGGTGVVPPEERLVPRAGLAVPEPDFNRLVAGGGLPGGGAALGEVPDAAAVGVAVGAVGAGAGAGAAWDCTVVTSRVTSPMFVAMCSTSSSVRRVWRVWRVGKSVGLMTTLLASARFLARHIFYLS